MSLFQKKLICWFKPIPRTTKTMSDLEPAGLSSDDAVEDGDFAAAVADIFEAFS